MLEGRGAHQAKKQAEAQATRAARRAEEERRAKIFRENLLSCRERLVGQVTSGELARRFGPRYTTEALTETSWQMQLDVMRMVPGFKHTDPARDAAIEGSVDSLFLSGIKIVNFDIDKIPMNYPREGSRNLRDSFLNVVWIVFATHVPFGKVNPYTPVDLELVMVDDPGGNRFSWEVCRYEDGIKGVEAKVKISDRVWLAMQEELFHAADELSFGSVVGLEALDPRIDLAMDYTAHTSLLLDFVLSAAASELGREEFSYWANRADRVTKEFREKFIGKLSAPWYQTPLGKLVNERFRFPGCDYKSLGAYLYNHSEDIEGFLLTEDGKPIPDNQILFDILCLRFGRLHADLAYRMIDVLPTQILNGVEDFEEAGRRLVEWGKMVLKHYKGKPEERELVTHHTHLDEPVKLTGGEDKIYTEIIRRINQSVGEGGIATTVINLTTLIDVVYRHKVAMVWEITNACFPDGPDKFVEPKESVLASYNLDREMIRKILMTAKVEWQKNLVSPDRFGGRILSWRNERGQLGDDGRGSIDMGKFFRSE